MDKGVKKIHIQSLQKDFSGQVVGPLDSEYDRARTVFMGDIDHKPAVIIRPKNASEVSKVILLARDTGLPLSIRSGGHGNGGLSVADRGIMLDLFSLRQFDIDEKERTAWAGSGLTAVEYTKHAYAHGLATGFGDTGSVGIGGITLGGGIGYFARMYGLTIDDVLAAEIVTADGNISKIDANNVPDLFWAIRGGGGNFGVVTKFRYRLHDIGKIIGGMMVVAATVQTIARYVEFASHAPEGFNAIFNVMTAPPMPFLPKEYVGKPIIMTLLAYIGEAGDGEQSVAQFKKIEKPIADMTHLMPYPEVYPPDQEGYHPMAAGRTMFMDFVDSSVAEKMLSHIESSKASMAVAQLRVLGGAMARVAPDATAFAHRQSNIMVNLAAVYQKPEEKDMHEIWVSDFMNDIQQSDSGAYVNFLGIEGESRVRAAYPGRTWERLQNIKTTYDPTNLFRLNQNIPPKSV